MNLEPAGRGQRFWAAVLDGFVLAAIPGIILAIMIPHIARTQHEGGSASDAAIAIPIILWTVYILALLVVQAVLLTKRGQTLGKIALKIKIVKHPSGVQAGFVTNVLVRGLLIQILYAIPYLGFVFLVVDLGMIFREDRRCCHDMLAGTQVVAA